MAHEYRNTYRDYNILFISDIRSSNENIVTEGNIEEDMVAQMRWYKILNPYMALLKFKPRYVSGYTDVNKYMDYLKGDILFQVWEPSHSSETRLLVRSNAENMIYDCEVYENECYYFQNYIRPSVYSMPDYKIPYMDKCYDCCAESIIFTNYLLMKDIAVSWKVPNSLGGPEGPKGTSKVKSSRVSSNVKEPSVADKEMIPEVKRMMEELTDNLGKRMISIKYGNVNRKVEFKEVLNVLKKDA